MFALPEGYTSQAGNVTVNNENLDGRMTTQYAGVTTTISGSIQMHQTDDISITNLDVFASDLRIGDYLKIEEELVRVKNTVWNWNCYCIPWCSWNKSISTWIWYIN